MGYLSRGNYIQTGTRGITNIELDIRQEIESVFGKRLNRRFTEFGFNQLSSQEQNDVIHEAGIRVQDRRKGRLVV